MDRRRQIVMNDILSNVRNEIMDDENFSITENSSHHNWGGILSLAGAVASIHSGSDFRTPLFLATLGFTNLGYGFNTMYEDMRSEETRRADNIARQLDIDFNLLHYPNGLLRVQRHHDGRYELFNVPENQRRFNLIQPVINNEEEIEQEPEDILINENEETMNPN